MNNVASFLHRQHQITELQNAIQGFLPRAIAQLKLYGVNTFYVERFKMDFAVNAVFPKEKVKEGYYAEFKELHAAPHEILKEAYNAGLAIKTSVRDLNFDIQLPKSDRFYIEDAAFQGESLVDTICGFKHNFPTFSRMLHSRIQANNLAKKIEKLRQQLLQELDIGSYYDEKGRRVSVFNTTRYKLADVPEAQDYKQRIQVAQANIASRLNNMCAEGKVERVFAPFIRVTNQLSHN